MTQEWHEMRHLRVTKEYSDKDTFHELRLQRLSF